MISGAATPEGTAGYAGRHPAARGHFRRFGDLAASSIGLGTYLGRPDEETDAAYESAVAAVLAGGVNVIDTAVNYRHMRSERAVGRALARAIGAGTVRREEVIVATKGGFIPFDGDRPADLWGEIDRAYVSTGLVRREELAGGCHSLAPAFLEDQLERSRRNLGLERIDVYYLHNPEFQLGSVSRDEFMRRFRTAVEWLESACRDGRIGAYGTATWNAYRKEAAAPDYLPLAAMTGMAEQVAGSGHRFRAVQFPFSLAQPEAAIVDNQPVREGRVTALEAARELGVYAMTSASILQGKLAQDLPEAIRRLPGPLRTDAQRALQVARSTPGVGTALVGMASPGHVRENLELVGVSPLAEEELHPATG